MLATFRQRFRAWLGRPVLEMRIELYPQHPPQGYPWHAYYGARFAWRDERATLLRGVNGTPSVTSHSRPESPDYLEIRPEHLGKGQPVKIRILKDAVALADDMARAMLCCIRQVRDEVEVCLGRRLEREHYLV